MLTGEGLATTIKAVMAKNETSAQNADAINALASAIINYITTNAIVIGICPSGGGPLTGGKVT